MTIHEQTQFRSFAYGPNSLAAVRLTNAVQRHRVRGASTICSRLPPGDIAASQSAQDLQALIQSALEVAEALDLAAVTATSPSSTLSSNTSQEPQEEKSDDSEPRPN